MLPKERQILEDTLDEAQTVLKQAHGKGVELECILEVNTPIALFQYSICNHVLLPVKNSVIYNKHFKLYTF